MSINNQMLIESRLQMIQEEILNREYREFFHAINRYGIHNLNRRLDEGIMDTVKSKMGFIKEVGELLKMDIKDIIESLKNKNVFRFFSEIKWSIKYFNDMMKKGFKMFSEVSSDAKEYIAQYRAKHPMLKDDAILRKAHEYIKNHPVLSKASSQHLKYFLIAVAVVGISAFGISGAIGGEMSQIITDYNPELFDIHAEFNETRRRITMAVIGTDGDYTMGKIGIISMFAVIFVTIAQILRRLYKFGEGNKKLLDSYKEAKKVVNAKNIGLPRPKTV
jgi:hypothetical protein